MSAERFSLRASHLVAAATLAAAAVWGIRTLFPSDEQRIRRELADLHEAINAVASGREDLARLSGAARIGKHVAPNVVVNLGPSAAVEGRDQVIALAARPRAAEAWQLAVSDVRVTLDERDQAHVTLVAAVTRESNEVVDERDVRLVMRRIEARWLIARVDVMESAGSRAGWNGGGVGGTGRRKLPPTSVFAQAIERATCGAARRCGSISRRSA